MSKKMMRYSRVAYNSLYPGKRGNFVFAALVLFVLSSLLLLDMFHYNSVIK